MTIRLEEAAKCLKCGTPGKLTAAYRRHIFEQGSWWDLCVYTCDRELCPWNGESWLVQSDPNGIVFEREIGPRGMDKTFQPISNDQLAFGRRVVEDAIRAEHNRDNF